MDSFLVIKHEDASEDLFSVIESTEPVSEEYAPIVWSSIKMAQMLEDRWQLFEMFCWNYDRYAEGLQSYLNDRVLTNAQCDDAESAFQRTKIDVNCFAFNLISAGVTLTESLRCFMKNEVGENDAEFQRFSEELTRLIDSRGTYSLMTKLRDETQHGQPLVSLYVDEQGSFRAAFDIDQLAQPEHFTVKGKFKDLLNEMKDQMDGLGAHHHRISYTGCMERYLIDVLEVVSLFYSCSSGYVQKVDGDLYGLIQSNPECLGELSGGTKFVFVYSDEAAHLLSGIETPNHQIHSMRQKAVSERLAEAKCRFKAITSQSV